jgi:restriction endonuclease S subunit
MTLEEVRERIRAIEVFIEKIVNLPNIEEVLETIDAKLEEAEALIAKLEALVKLAQELSVSKPVE